jgi:hypothetical protein
MWPSWVETTLLRRCPLLLPLILPRLASPFSPSLSLSSSPVLSSSLGSRPAPSSVRALAAMKTAARTTGASKDGEKACMNQADTRC